MRCISRRLRSAGSLFMVCVISTSLLSGCSGGEKLEDAFRADSPGFGIHSQEENGTVSYFAEDLCVVNEDIEEIEADTSEASAACFFDLDSKEVLYAKNVHERLYPASTTKIMTALTALEHGDLDAQMTVSKEAITFTESGVSTAKLKEGDVLTLRQLLYALLLVSANDAANVIAEGVAGSTDEFVAMMNAEAQKIGATNSHFVNANGLHNEEHYTTVYDLYLMFQAALKYEEFYEMIQQPSFDTIYTAADGTAVDASWTSSNLFTKGDVTVPDGVKAVGGKTGTTTAAQSCLVQLFEDSEGKQYTAIILGCKERVILYEEMQSFLSNLNN